MAKNRESERIAVVGGGIAGLTAAAFLGRAGLPVTLLESSSELGGRVATRELGGFCFNFGAHALYNLGAVRRALLDLGIEIASLPPSNGLFAVLKGRLHLLPTGPMSLLRTDLVTMPEKLELASLLGKLQKGGEGWHERTAREWIDETTESESLRLLLAGLFRLSGLANDLDRQDAGAILDQLRLAIRANVLYVHDGWKTLVDGLAATIEGAGRSDPSRHQSRGPSRWQRLERSGLSADEIVEAADVILAVTPAAASRLAGPFGVQILGPEDLHPVRAACLDLGLSKLPRPDRLFALRLDSATARLAPKGKALVHLLLLRDVYDYSGIESAEALAMSVANLKTTLHRARRALADYDRNREPPSPQLQRRHQTALGRLMECFATRDVRAMERLLADDISVLSDGGGEFHAARVSVVGRHKVALFFSNVVPDPQAVEWEFRTANGQPALLLRRADPASGVAPRWLFRIEVNEKGLIRRAHAVLATRKLVAMA